MQTTTRIALLLLPLAAACVGTQRDASVPLEPSVATPAPNDVTPRPQRELSATEIAIWNSPRFQRDFIESYKAETEIEPRLTVVEIERMQQVLELISGDRLDKAVALLEKHGGPAASAVFDFTLGNIAFQREELGRAAEHYAVAVEKMPKFRRAWRNKGLIHAREGAFEEAALALTKVIELGGSDALTYGLLGYAYGNLENEVAAESAYRMAVLLDPETLDWKMGLAKSFFEQERFADAAALCKRLIADEPERSDLWLLQANAFLGLGQPLRAAQNFELVERLGKSTPDSLNMLGDIYVNEELFDLGVDAYLAALELGGEGPPVRALRAAKVLTSRGALTETGALIDGIETLRGAALDDETRKDLLRLRARLAVAQGSGAEEVRVLEELVALDPLDGEALILLGQHAARHDDAERATFYYERAAALEAHEADANVRHAQLLVGQARYDEALRLLRRAQAVEPRENVEQYLKQVERIAANR